MTIYIVDSTPLIDDDDLSRILPHLSDERRTKVCRLRVAEKRAQSATAGLLLRYLFGDSELGYGKHGKPYLKDGSAHFSLTHSRQWVACAVAGCEVGIDIEPISPIRPAVLRRCFTEREQSWIGDNSHRFARLWTMKEAYMKLTGTGLSVPAKAIEFPLPPQEGYDERNRCFWMFPKFDLPISICADSSSAHIEVVRKSIKDLL